MRPILVTVVAGAALLAMLTPALADPLSLGALITAAFTTALGGGTTLGFGAATVFGINAAAVSSVVGGVITIATSRSMLVLDRQP